MALCRQRTVCTQQLWMYSISQENSCFKTALRTEPSVVKTHADTTERRLHLLARPRFRHCEGLSCLEVRCTTTAHVCRRHCCFRDPPQAEAQLRSRRAAAHMVIDSTVRLSDVNLITCTAMLW
jgi:hypothetical protein